MSAEEQTSDGRWVPSCPLPLYVRSWRTLFRWRYRCECGLVFGDEGVYKAHWRLKHADGPARLLEKDSHQ